LREVRLIPDWKILQQFELFSNCSQGDLETISGYCDLQEIGKLEYIYCEDDTVDSVYLIIKGRIELSIQASGGDRIIRLGILEDGTMFGIGEIFLDQCYTNAWSITACNMVTITKDDFKEILIRFPGVNEALLSSLSGILRNVMLRISEGTGRNDLVNYLWYLYRQWGSVDNTTITVNKHLTQGEIAEILNLSREQVNRLIQQLKKERCITWDGGQVTIDYQWLDSEISNKERVESLFHRYHPLH
jgi:CRP-like cAMP-binding protein